MITQTQIMWTCLPNGIVAGSNPLQVKVSLVVTPQLFGNSNGVNTIKGTVFENWPAYVRAIDAAAKSGGWGVSFDNNNPSNISDGVMVDHLSSSQLFNVDGGQLWQAIFPPTTPVSLRPPGSAPNFKVHSYDAGRIAKAIRAAHAYAVESHVTHGKLVLTGSDPYSVLLSEGKKAKAVLPKMMAVARGLAHGATHHVLQDAYRAETGDLEVGYELMRHAMFYDPVARRGANDKAPLAKGMSSGAPALANDFNTLFAHLGGQPMLLRKLGLIIDLVVNVPSAVPLQPAGTTPQFSHLVWLSTLPAVNYQSVPTLQNVASLTSVQNVNPSTVVDLTQGMFRPSLGVNIQTTKSAGSINNGFLPLGDTSQYTIMTEDTEGTPYKLDAASAGPAAPTFPALRTGGLAVAQNNRDTVLAGDGTSNNVGLLGRQEKFAAAIWVNATPSDAQFAAEDLVRGYAVDIAVGPAPAPGGQPLQFQSLCLRDSRLSFPGLTSVPQFPQGAPTSFVISDEGYTKATTAASPDGTGSTTELDLHSVLFGWSGWSLAVQRPGRAITAATPPGDIVQTETPLQPVNAPDPSFPAGQIVVRARAGSLPRLRFGQSYTFRARVVDLAGNDMSLSCVGAPELFTSVPNVWQSPARTYLRYEPVPNPVLVLQAPLTEGEHLENLVIRSNPWGPGGPDASTYAAASGALNPMNGAYSATSARWVAPPKGAWGQAEQLGAFDANYLAPMSAALELDIKAPGAQPGVTHNLIVPGQPYVAGATPNAATFLSLKNALFLCSQKEAGVFTDGDIWDASDTGASGPSAKNVVQIVTPQAAQNLPPPTNPGQPLAPGQYAVLVNQGPGSPPHIPYLPDANAQGIVFQQVVQQGQGFDAQQRLLPSVWMPTGSQATVTYGPRVQGGKWPEVALPQIVLQQAPAGAQLPVIANGGSNKNPSGLDSAFATPSAPGSLPTAAGNTQIVFSLAPGAQFAVNYGSVVADTTKMENSAPGSTIAPYAPPRLLTMVHAVQQPKPPSLLTPTTPLVTVATRKPGDTSVTITGGFLADGLTSQSVDLTAAWADLVDVEPGAGVSPVGDGTNRSYVVKSGRLESWTLTTTGDPTAPETKIQYPTPPAAATSTSQAIPAAVPIVQQFGDTKTRQVFYQAVATSRFREYFPASLQSTAANFQSSYPSGAFTDSDLLYASYGVRVPATTRPAAPKILYVVPTFQWGSSVSRTVPKTTSHMRSGGGLRVFVDRPWYSTGDTEQLGVVVNPVGVNPPPPGLANYVSQWGPDPIRDPQADQLPVLDQSQLTGGSGTVYTGVPLAENSRALVTVVPHQPTAYDPVRELWYFDIEFAESAVEAPFVRLALARFQPNALGTQTFPNSDDSTATGDLRMSPLVFADMVKLAAGRTATYIVNANGTVSVTLSGVVYSSAKWTPSSGTLSANKVNDAAATGRMVFAQVQEATSATPGEFDWKPVGSPINLAPFQMAGSTGDSTSLTFMPVTATGAVTTIPKPTGLTAGAKHQLLITEHEVFFTDAVAAFPGSLNPAPLNYPGGTMPMVSSAGGSAAVAAGSTTSRIVFSDTLPLPY